MSGWWSGVISRATQSRGSLLKFGAQLTVGAVALGYAFSYFTVRNATPEERKKFVESLDYDKQRFADAQQQRLSMMLKDLTSGKDDEHWAAAMRGTLKPHPKQENRTQRLDKG